MLRRGVAAKVNEALAAMRGQGDNSLSSLHRRCASRYLHPNTLRARFARTILPDLMPPKISDEERDALEAELERLRQEHRDLDAAIDALAAVGPGDQLQVQRLKKRKLALRDRLSFVEDQLTPDIIA